MGLNAWKYLSSFAADQSSQRSHQHETKAAGQPFVPVAHEIAKLILERAATPHEREEAILKAVGLGMPLHEIERYLDWLDFIRRRDANRGTDPRSAE